MCTRVCIADDHLLMLTGIRKALDDADEIEVVGVTQREDEVLGLVGTHLPDLILLDHRMPGLDGMGCIKLIRARHPQVKIVMLSASEDATHISDALAAGASAYIGERIQPNDLGPALRQIVSGVVYHAGPQQVPVPAPDPVPAAGAAANLTERELTMLAAISQGLSTKAISRELFISEKTVKFHLTNIYRKLGVHNRTGAMRYALDHGLVSLAPPSADVAVAVA